MTKSLHHSFDPQIAAEYGLEEAILIHHFQYWIEFNKKRDKNFHNERTWTYGSLKEIASHFPYLSIKQVRRAIDKLVENGVLIKGNFNKSPYDRTCWYAFDNEELFISKTVPSQHLPKNANGFSEKGAPIPHTKTNIDEEEEANQISWKAEKLTKRKISKEDFYELILDHGLAVTRQAFNSIADENGDNFQGFNNLKAYIKKKIKIIQKFKGEL